MSEDKLICRICGKESKSLGNHIYMKHKMIKKEYDKIYFNIDENNFEFQCKICERKFISSTSLKDHIWNAHKIKYKEYYDKFFKKDTEGICKICGKETRFYGGLRGYNIYCSTKCFNSDPETRLNFSNKGKQWYIDHPEERERISKQKKDKKIIVSEEEKNRRIERSPWKKGHTPWNKGKTLSNEHKKKLSKAQLKRFEKEEEIIKIRESHLEYYREHPEKRKEAGDRLIEYRKTSGGKPSKIQIKLYNIILSKFPDAIMEVSCGNYFIDIVIPSINIAIEYEGFYWHHNREDFDNKRQKYIESVGYKIIRYRGKKKVDVLPTKEEIFKHIEEVNICL